MVYLPYEELTLFQMNQYHSRSTGKWANYEEIYHENHNNNSVGDGQDNTEENENWVSVWCS